MKCVMVVSGVTISLLSIFAAGYADQVSMDTITRYYSIHPSAFCGNTNNLQYEIDYDKLVSPGDNGQYYAPVNLPDSAQVTEFKIWIYDANTSGGIAADLVRCAPPPVGSAYMARVLSVGNAGYQELTDTTIDYSVIDNENYRYCVALTMDAGTYVFGVRIRHVVYQETPAVDEISTKADGVPTVEMYPVPFRNETVIKYAIPKAQKVSIKIYDETGKLVRTLTDNTMPQGYYTARWDGKDSNGRIVAAGSYFCVVKSNGSTTKKTLHIK